MSLNKETKPNPGQTVQYVHIGWGCYHFYNTTADLKFKKNINKMR